jgi:endonuclease YncB( thermonuclease family)
MTWLMDNDNNRQAQAQIEDKKRRVKIAQNPKSAVNNTTSFRTASRAMNTNFASGLLKSKSDIKGSKSFKWEKDNLWDLPRSYGRSYDDKFKNYSKKVLGISDAESERFRRYLDAKESGKTTDDFVNDTMKQALSRAKFTASEKADEAPIVPHTRGRIEKIFDVLGAGAHASANAVHYKLNGKSFWKGAKEGLIASLPWETKNGEANRRYYADVLKDDVIGKGKASAQDIRDIFATGGAGAVGYGASKLITAMNPDGKNKWTDTADKIGVGGAGLALDILGDPTTYMTGGTSALIKGSGKGLLRKGATLTEDAAKSIVESHAAKTGTVLDDATKTVEAKKLMDKYHGVLGTNRQADNVKIGLGKAKVELPGSAKALQAVGDVTVAPVYNSMRKVIYGTQLGKLFSTKSGLYNLAKEDPAKVYDVMDFMTKTQGMHADKIKGEQEFREYAKQNLQNLSESDITKVMEMMQDKTIWSKVKRIVDVKGMSEARTLKRKMEAETKLYAEHLNNVDAQRNTLDMMHDENFSKLDDARKVQESAQKEYIDNVATLEVNKIQDDALRQKALEHKQNAARILDAKYEGLSNPLKPHQEMPNLIDAGAKPTRPYVKNPKEPKLGDFVDLEIKQLQWDASGVLDDWNNLKNAAPKSKKGDPIVNNQEMLEKAGQFSQLLFGSSDKISPAVYPSALDQIEKMIKEGWNKHDIIEHIQTHPHQYDGRARDINSYVADHFGYGAGRKYESWKEFYTDRVEAIYKRAEANNGTVLKSDEKTLEELEHIKMERAMLRTEMMDMNKSELLAFRTKKAEEKMYETLNMANQQEFMDEVRRNKFTDEDRAQVDEFRGVDRKTHEFDDKESLSLERKQELKEQLKRTGEYFNDNDVADVRARLIREFRENGNAGKGQLAAKQTEWMNKVINNIPEIMLRNFGGKKWEDLSVNAQKFIVGMAKRHVMAKADGKEVKFESGISKKIKERAEVMQEWEHAEAVRATASVGSEVVLRNEKTGIRTTGEVVATHVDEDDLVTYVIRDKKGNEKTVQAKEIFQVNKKKPTQYVLENTMEERVNKAYEEAMNKYKQDLEKAKAERVAKKEEYTQSVQEWEAKHQANYEEMARVDALNNASEKEWNDAIRNSSEVADDYLKQRDALGEEIKDLEWNGIESEAKFLNMKSEIENDYKMFTENQDKTIRELEMNHDALQKQLDDLENSEFDGMKLDELTKKYNTIKEASDNWHAFETYLESNMRSQLDGWDTKYGNKDLGKVVIESTDATALQKRLVTELRGYFQDVAVKELEAGYLEKGQVDKWLEGYLTHLPTPEGDKFFRKYTIKEKDGVLVPELREQKTKKADVTDDLGYGEVFSPYSLSRQIKSLKLPDGTIVFDPTIQQINQMMRPFLNGKNAFSENVADIFIARMLKHNELMYDDKYMNEMFRSFGKNLPDNSFVPEAGHKVVMNYGLYKKNVHDFAKIQGSLKMSTDIREYIQYNRENNLPIDVDKFIKEYIDSGKPKENYDEFVDYGFKQLGMTKDNFKDLSTPLLVVSPEQAKNMSRFHEATLSGLKQKYKKYLDELEIAKEQGDDISLVSPESLAKIAEYDELLQKTAPLEIKQMNDVIVHKANQARELQFAKNRNGLVKMYDKFTHFMKLNQTAIMPSFHVRNAKSNLFQVWLAVGSEVANVGMHRDSWMALKNEGQISGKGLEPIIMKDADGNTIGAMEWDEMYNLARTHDVIDQGVFGKDFQARDESMGLMNGAKVKGVSLDPTNTRDFIGYKVGSAVGSRIENQARFFQFATHVKNGMSPADAKEMVNKFLFDYSDLTGFEHDVMRRIFPFYTWIRKNGRLQVSQLIEQPGKYRDVSKVMNSVSGGIPDEDQVESQYLSPFARDWKQTILNYTSEDKDGKVSTEPVLWNPNLPFMDFQRIPNPLDPAGAIKTMIPQMNSLPKSIIEQGFNKNFFFDDKIVADKDNAAQGLLKRLDYEGRQFSPYTAVVDFAKKNGVDRYLHVLNQVTGEKFLSYDYATSKDMTIKKYMGGEDPEDKPLWIDQALDKVSAETMTRRVQGDLTELTRKYISGEELTKENTGAYYPFVKVMQTVGLDNGGARDWVGGLVEGTNLDRYLLGNDFANAQVTSVRDGDSLDVLINGKHEAIRFNLVDTPEVKHDNTDTDDNTQIMPFGNEAQRWTESAVKGKNIQLIISKNADMHGRLVAYVYVDGKDLNKQLLEQGLAQVRYSNLSTNPYKKDEYKKVGQQAAKDKKGIWQIDGYADPNYDAPYNKSGAMKRYLELKGVK